MSETVVKGMHRQPSINALAANRAEDLVNRADSLRLSVYRHAGSTIVDAGIDARGGLEAGRRIAELCMGGMGTVDIFHGSPFRNWPTSLHVHTSNPVLACLGSQYAGWSISDGKGKDAFHALGSGPARALARKEPIFGHLNYVDASDRTALVLEVDSIPPEQVIKKIAQDCGVEPDRLTVVLTPTRSLAGSVQVVARVLEVALHKAHELGFPLASIVDGTGSAPMCPPAKNFIQAMGRTNDAILFGGVVHLFVEGDDASAEQLAQQLPSSASRDYGRPFAEVFSAYDYDFFQIDPMLFSPALVHVTALESGRTFHAGRLDESLIDRSFGASQ